MLALMNRHHRGLSRKSLERFRLCFQKRLRDYFFLQRSAAEGFGLAWEKTLEEVPLSDADQAEVYWQLIDWARSDFSFTGPQERALLQAWKQTVHEL
jgi:hypothetical protein